MISKPFAAALLATLSLGAGAALAASDKDIATCAVIDGDLDRLSCFDALAESAGLDGPQPRAVELGDVGDWVVSRDQNPIDDSERVVLRLVAKDGKSTWGDAIGFFARCQSGETEAFISWNDYLGNDSGDFSSEWKNVTIRIGGAKAVEQQWSLSTDSKATFAPGNATALLEDMARSEKFIAQVTPYGESPVTAIFDTTGMAEALQPLAEVCGWDL